MRTLALAVLLVIPALVSGCPQSTYGDAAVDAQPLPPQTIDVGPTTGDAAPPMCPGNLFGLASENQASCTQANEACTQPSTSGANTIECHCNAQDGGTALWSCQMQ